MPSDKARQLPWEQDIISESDVHMLPGFVEILKTPEVHLCTQFYPEIPVRLLYKATKQEASCAHWFYFTLLGAKEQTHSEQRPCFMKQRNCGKESSSVVLGSLSK